MANLSDIMEGATKCKIEVGYGHGKSYWDKNDSSLATEAFAEMTGSLMANDESTKILRQYLPESFKVYEEMLKDALKEV